MSMRIIAGEHRGRKLIGPKDDTTTRPITDRVKQSVFDKIQAHGLFEGGQVIDLFSGTGSMGLEAISRGSSFCTFVDQDKDAIDRLNQNIRAMRIEDKTSVHRGSVGAMMWTHAVATQGPVQVAFIDPPYALMYEEDGHTGFTRVMEALFPLMDATGVVMLRVPKQVDPLPVTNWRGPRTEKYGGMKVAYYALEHAPEQVSESNSADQLDG